MSKKFIVFQRTDSGLTIRNPTARSRRDGETETEWRERIAATHRDKPGLLGAERLADCTPEDLPRSRRFRNCWRSDGTGSVHVDMPLARGQRMNEIRAERGGRFAALDAEWMKATGQNNAARADAVETVRQQLRDIPNGLIADGTLEGIATPEELEAFDPEWPEV